MPKPKRFYGKGIPGVVSGQLRGQLIVVEGADGSGRSMQIDMLRDWLERRGYPTVNVGLKRSMLVSRELEQAMRGNILGTRTLSLFMRRILRTNLKTLSSITGSRGWICIADPACTPASSNTSVRSKKSSKPCRHIIGLTPSMETACRAPSSTSFEQELSWS